MKVTAHCFARESKIEPKAINFKFKEYDAQLFLIDKDLTLQLSRRLSQNDLDELKKNDLQPNDINKDLEVKLLPYKIALTEAAQTLEGLFSILYISIPPQFDTNTIYVNLFAETDEDQSLIEDETITRFFGNISIPRKKSFYKIDLSFTDLIGPSIEHIPAYSFFAQATRSLEKNDNEIAFFLYFRIIDGYFSDGKKDIEKELLKKAVAIQEYLPYNGELIKSICSILTEMGIASPKSHLNFEGLIKDIVLIRHKLTHFSTTNAKKHHSASVKFELFTVNSYLHQACFLLLRDKINLNLSGG